MTSTKGRITVALSVGLLVVAAAWSRAADRPAEKAPGGGHNRATDWLSEAKIGAFMHFLPDASSFALVDEFDVAAVTRQLADSGVRYLVFTLGQNSGYMNAPNDTYERIAGFAPGTRCARRDLPKELAAALKPHGIRLMLYLPCQTPNRDLEAIRAFGLPEAPENRDRKLDLEFAKKWAHVIREWSDRYGDAVSGWWFDGGYEWIGFNSQIARVYAEAAKHGNPQAVVTFNPGVSLKRWTDAEDYTAGELNDPFTYSCSGRWLDGSQWHALTFLGDAWGRRNTRHPDDRWTEWVGRVTAEGGVVTLDMGPNWDAAAGPVGTFSEAQLRQLQAIVRAVRDPAGSQAAKPRMKLGAYYFEGWAGRSAFDDGTPQRAWAKGMPTHFTKKLATEYAGRTPLWGWRDDDPEIMERQIDLAADHGVAFFSFCWYWRDNKGPINVEAIENDSLNVGLRLFLQAKNNHRMEFCLLVANHGGSEIVGPEAWKQAADYWMPLFEHPRYLRVEGRPLLVIFSPRGSNPEGLTYLQQAARKAGLPGVAVAGCGGGKPEEGYSLRTHYNVRPPGPGVSARHAYQELVEANVRAWHGSPEQPLIPVATQGWDRRPWEATGGEGLGKGSPVSWYFQGRTPEAFGRLLDRMARWIDAHPEQTTKDRLALVYAWNEMGEGGWLVPCRDDPDGAYLKAIRRVVLGK